jgi:hypothetical protein
MDRAGEWFLRSGIQGPSGGVARYYRSDLGANARISTEITGYAASTLVWLHQVTSREEYLAAARRAGWFLARQAWDPAAAAMPFEYAVDGDLPRAFFFDLGIIVRGLVALFRATGEREFLASAEACAASMVHDFAGGEEFHPIVTLPDKQPAPWEARWSRQPGCYQLKSALGWHELDEQTGQAGYQAPFEQVLAYALASHAAFLPGEVQPERIMDRLHAYCYFLEGLLPCAGRAECAAALGVGLKRLEGLCEEIAPRFERSDVVAQTLRLRLLANGLGVLPLDEVRAAREADRVLGYQLDHPDPRVAGGFLFGRKGAELLPYVNPVSTAFSVQALEMWRQHQAGRLERAWQTLI